MAESESESLFSTFDLILIALLGVFAVYYLLLKNKKKVESTPPPSFTIAPTASATQASSDDSWVSSMKNSGKTMVVFYGSQTGTAEEYAGRLAKEAARYGLKAVAADPEECDMSDLTSLASEIPDAMAVFCMATYGEGDPTDNAQEFYEWLQSDGAELGGLRFSVFGLGNKTYEQYNAMGKYVDKRLAQLGATRVFELGMGDDDGNLEEDFLTWKEHFWPAVCEHFGLEATGEDVNMREYKLRIIEDINANKVYHGEIVRLHSFENQRPPFDAKNPFLAPVVVNRELQKGGDRKLLHLELNIEGSRIRYDAGDHIAVYPTNDSELVNRLGELCETDLDTVISLDNIEADSNKKHPFPCPCSYRTALMHYVDITSAPRTHVLKGLAEFTSDPEDKEKLKAMGSMEGKELYGAWIVDSCRNIVHVLEDMPTCKPPLDYICELLPRLQARYYSISSSPKVHPTTIHITCVLVSYQTPTGRHNKGVATTYLMDKKVSQAVSNGSIPGHGTEEEEQEEGEGEKEKPTVPKHMLVPCYTRKSQFRLPHKHQTPVIMVGPGTGLAPFRGFIQERAFYAKQGKPVGETVLFYGCRKEHEDFMYRSELDEYVAEGVLKMHVAFSRDQGKKVYVQHLMEREKENIWRIIGKEDGHFYVCGDAKNMARDVHKTLTNICVEVGGMSEEEAEKYVKRMLTQKRYSQDVWS